MNVIIQYNAGNVQSVRYALARIGAKALVTDDAGAIRSAERVIFPGVGEASSAMRYLAARGLDQVIRDLKQPVLGICLGMQLMCRYSEENDTACLGIFGETVRLFRPAPAAGAGGGSPADSGTPRLKVPQIGWNTLRAPSTALFDGVPEGAYVYSVHSYCADTGPHTIATMDYGGPYSAALHRANFHGVQFHPEKSADVGEKILRNFLSM